MMINNDNDNNQLTSQVEAGSQSAGLAEAELPGLAEHFDYRDPLG